MSYLNEVSEWRKKKDLCSKEAKLPSLNLSRSEEIEQNNLKSIYGDGRECPKSS